MDMVWIQSRVVGRESRLQCKYLHASSSEVDPSVQRAARVLACPIAHYVRCQSEPSRRGSRLRSRWFKCRAMDRCQCSVVRTCGRKFSMYNYLLGALALHMTLKVRAEMSHWVISPQPPAFAHAGTQWNSNPVCMCSIFLHPALMNAPFFLLPAHVNTLCTACGDIEFLCILTAILSKTTFGLLSLTTQGQ